MDEIIEKSKNQIPQVSKYLSKEIYDNYRNKENVNKKKIKIIFVPVITILLIVAIIISLLPPYSEINSEEIKLDLVHDEYLNYIVYTSAKSFLNQDNNKKNLSVEEETNNQYSCIEIINPISFKLSNHEFSEEMSYFIEDNIGYGTIEVIICQIKFLNDKENIIEYDKQMIILSGEKGIIGYLGTDDNKKYDINDSQINLKFNTQQKLFETDTVDEQNYTFNVNIDALTENITVNVVGNQKITEYQYINNTLLFKNGASIINLTDIIEFNEVKINLFVTQIYTDQENRKTKITVISPSTSNIKRLILDINQKIDFMVGDMIEVKYVSIADEYNPIEINPLEIKISNKNIMETYVEINEKGKLQIVADEGLNLTLDDEKVKLVQKVFDKDQNVTIYLTYSKNFTVTFGSKIKLIYDDLMEIVIIEDSDTPTVIAYEFKFEDEKIILKNPKTGETKELGNEYKVYDFWNGQILSEDQIKKMKVLIETIVEINGEQKIIGYVGLNFYLDKPSIVLPYGENVNNTDEILKDLIPIN